MTNQFSWYISSRSQFKEYYSHSFKSFQILTNYENSVEMEAGSKGHVLLTSRPKGIDKKINEKIMNYIGHTSSAILR